MAYDDLAFGGAAGSIVSAVCISCARTWSVRPDERLCPSCAIPLRRVTAEQAERVDRMRAEAHNAEIEAMHAPRGRSAPTAAGTTTAAPPQNLPSLLSLLLHQAPGGAAADNGTADHGPLSLLASIFGASLGADGEDEDGRPASEEAISALPRKKIADFERDLPHLVHLSVSVVTASPNTALALPETIAGVHDCVAVPAVFSGPLGVNAEGARLPQIVPASPTTGAGWVPAAGAAAGSVVLFDRGAVTFAQKGLAAQRAGAAGGIVVQAADRPGEWPLEMIDAAGEIAGGALRIPFVMVSPADGRRIRGLLDQASAAATREDSSAVSSVQIAMRRSGGGAAEECPVCCERFAMGDCTVLLPCQHVYHEACIVPWLHRRHTCPLCRCELPLPPAAAEAVERERQAHLARERERRLAQDREVTASSWYA